MSTINQDPTQSSPGQFSPVRRSAMHHKHVELGASMAERDGWQLPASFGSLEEETKFLSGAVGIYDISPQAKFMLKGDDLGQLISKVFPASSMSNVGDLSLTVAPGGSDANTALCRLADDEILCLGPADRATALGQNFNEHSGQCAHALDITSGLAGVGITGPLAARLMGMLSELDTSDPAFANLRCAQSKLADIHGTVLRIDTGSIPSYQVYFGREFGEYVWQAMIEAAAVCGGGPVGFEAVDGLLR